MENSVQINKIKIGQKMPLALIAGPCVIEDAETTYKIASYLKKLTSKINMPLIFKASFDKANRSSLNSYRGPGLKDGLKLLADIKKDLDIAVVSDIHETNQIDAAAQVLDVLQIPAFLCRQTDFLIAAARCGKPVNIKKGQFLAPWDAANIIEKIQSTGNTNILLTERGSMFGYNNLVVDFRSITIMQQMNIPVIFDATHSVQLPGGQGQSSGGQRQYAPVLARAAAAAGADALFLEVHPDPDKALCDGPNSLYLDSLLPLLKQVMSIRQIILHGAE
ncbi:MAG: 3-deoxy-8-phosphooctulonate synthase [Desulfobacteraceae bacterium]|nr:3-deoxy-8-phosphooctulonate synthase [Desulfobacteraceae bacterium]